MDADCPGDDAGDRQPGDAEPDDPGPAEWRVVVDRERHSRADAVRGERRPPLLLDRDDAGPTTRRLVGEGAFLSV